MSDVNAPQLSRGVTGREPGLGGERTILKEACHCLTCQTPMTRNLFGEWDCQPCREIAIFQFLFLEDLVNDPTCHRCKRIEKIIIVVGLGAVYDDDEFHDIAHSVECTECGDVLWALDEDVNSEIYGFPIHANLDEYRDAMMYTLTRYGLA